MYIPEDFVMENPDEIVPFMQQYNFAVLVTIINNTPQAVHLPFLIDYQADKLVLSSHLAKANPIANYLDKTKLLIVFSEPHAYISPSLYTSYPNVPTWNYVAVHAYGQGRVLNSQETLMLMEKSVAHFEPQKEKFWDNLPPYYRESLLDELVAFEIEVDKVEAKKKLNQNKTAKDRKNIVQHLVKSSLSHEQEIAKMMQKLDE
jgi:transcriptional regulator